MTTAVILESLVKTQQWQPLLEASTQLLSVSPNLVRGLHFQGLAYLRLGQMKNAQDSLEQCLRLDPTNRWCHFLLIESYRKSGQLDRAIEWMIAYLENHPADEEAKSVLVNDLVEAGRFSDASAWNGKRSATQGNVTSARTAIALQTFIKSDTLESFFDSVSKCDEADQFDLIIIQDSTFGSRKFAEREDEHRKVRQTIGQWIPILSERFNNVTFHANKKNRGTTATCKRLVDYVATNHEAFIFFEDDCVLSSNALVWISQALNHVKDGGPLFVGGESIFFDTRGDTIDEITSKTWASASQAEDLKDAYVTSNFVPSTCFATTSEIWRLVSSIRGFPLGDIDVNKFLKSEGIKPVCILPVVPRVKDVGMQHNLGYSVAHHGQAVREKKTTMLLSDSVVVREHIKQIPSGDPRLAGLLWTP
jgi:tetratricopeptide (TPR) repeat protein